MNENTRTRRAFDLYWELGASRSIERLHEVMASRGRAPSVRTLYAWSSVLQWQRRIARLEEDARCAEDKMRVQEVREMVQRHIREAVVLQQKGAEWIRAKGSAEVTADAAIRAIVEGTRMEWLARGEPTERQEVTNELQINHRLAALGDDELDRLIEFAESSLGRTIAAKSPRPLWRRSQHPPFRRIVGGYA